MTQEETNTEASSTEKGGIEDGRTAISIIRRGLEYTPEFRSVAGSMVGAGILLGLGRIAVPILFQRTIDEGLLSDGGVDDATLVRLALITFFVVVGVSLLSLLTQLLIVRMGERALARLRVAVLRRAVDLSLAEHAAERQGDIVSRTTGDIETLSRFLDWGAYAWLVNGSVILTAAITMFVYSWQLATVAVIALALMIPVLVWIQRRQQRAYGALRDRTGDLLAEATETISGAEVVRSFGQQDMAIDQLDADVDAAYDAQMYANRFGSVLFTVSDIFGTLAIAAVVLTVVWLGPVEAPGFGTTIALLFLVQLVLVPLAELTEVTDDTSLALAGWERAIDLASRPQLIPEPAQPQPVPRGALPVTLDQVSFSYEDHQVLHEIDLEIPQGTSVAIVGATGSGKTTLARLLCRLADPQDGAVRLGGVDLRDMSGDDRRAAVRMVPQDGFLFATTVLDNVLKGRAGATPAEAEEAVDRLGLGEWVARLPHGLDTEIGPGGDGLSVGERQLVAIIRAALADPGVLILDEATSSLDPSTERAMSDALDRLEQGRTTVTVAHRLSTAERADTVVVLDHGHLVEHGPHDELLAAGGPYADLHSAWTRGVGVSDPA